jgi:NAD(P)-dependent dehydrogenase (short-subunit alcohol dehydrogenase family)
MPPDVYFDKLDDFKFRGSKPSPNGAGIRNLFSRYAVSKLANLLFAKSLQQHMDAENIPIISTSLHPGFVYTKGSAGIFPGWMEPVSWLLGSSPAQGAAPGLYLATAPDVKKDPRSFKGLYFDTSCKAVTTSALARDPQMAENLWKLSEEAVAEYTAPGANLKSGKHS